MDWQHAIPGYLEAVREEQLLRNAAFLDCSASTNGFMLSPLVLEKYLALVTIRSPIISGGRVGLLELVEFLWLLNPGYHPKARLRRWIFLKFKCSKLRKNGDLFLAVLEYVNDFVNEQLADMGKGKAGPSKSFYSDAAYVCFVLRPWPEDYVLKMPMSRVIQYLNIANIDKGILPSNPKSDGIISAWQVGRQKLADNANKNKKKK